MYVWKGSQLQLSVKAHSVFSSAVSKTINPKAVFQMQNLATPQNQVSKVLVIILKNLVQNHLLFQNQVLPTPAFEAVSSKHP